MGSTALPKLVAFDLDGTLWWPEMYMLDGGAPFRRDPKTGAVYDRRNEQIELMGASEAVLRELATDPKWADTEVAYVSRTEYPEWAIPCLKAFVIAEADGKRPLKTMYDLSAHQEIYPGSKVTHFRKIHKESGIPYDEMIFYDNESWNCKECSKLGIHCVYTPRGLTRDSWERGLADYAAAKAATGSP
ncbi:hypothetical protein HYH03_012989 [Edaphochlamys debaryana]|uniref:Magnesium-dependent phosphatase-1 n=1 Tax=Edaphochlamys debaryana TaxID=47281 RepID=A0A836BTL9_9CHLO|nr:hypothetical protein HYH03_012989 [Edaphochlamys debaryana]|eukprot:KAG2488485.1 hypothetical protein HYH03_012989 [Edaphochlamys debaryana]